MKEAVLLILFGASIFCIGITIGWGMRGSVKEEETLHLRTILDRLEQARWKLDELSEKVEK